MMNTHDRPNDLRKLKMANNETHLIGTIKAVGFLQGYHAQQKHAATEVGPDDYSFDFDQATRGGGLFSGANTTPTQQSQLAHYEARQARQARQAAKAAKAAKAADTKKNTERLKQHPVKVWTDNQGRRVRARVVSAGPDGVRLQTSDGTVLKVRNSDLSTADQRFINWGNRPKKYQGRGRQPAVPVRSVAPTAASTWSNVNNDPDNPWFDRAQATRIPADGLGVLSANPPPPVRSVAQPAAQPAAQGASKKKSARPSRPRRPGTGTQPQPRPQPQRTTSQPRPRD